MRYLIGIFVLLAALNSWAGFGSNTALPFFHVEQLGGKSWRTNSQSDLINLASIEILTQTGANKIKAVFEFESEGAGDVFFFEETTVSANGSAATIFNMNRNFANLPLTTVFMGPTITGDGTLLDAGLIPGDSKKGTFGGNVRGGVIILKPNTKYLCRVTNVSGATASYVLRMFFSEF